MADRARHAGTTGVLHAFWEEHRARIDAELDSRLPAHGGEPARLYAAMRHAVMGGGKRLRPILAVAAYRSLGGRSDTIYPVAAALEILHTYSLIHDDLPSMDDDDQRRGRPTVHIAFDEPTAILAGDALQALAFEVLAEAAPVEVVRLVAHAAGPECLVGGQMADIEAEGGEPTEALVLGIHRRKTGALIAASAEAGAVMAGATASVCEQVQRYARPLGLAFQIADDVLELTQSAEALGKPVGSDLKHQKMTYPAAVGLDAARMRASALIAEAKGALDGFPGDPVILLALADFVIERDR